MSNKQKILSLIFLVIIFIIGCAKPFIRPDFESTYKNRIQKVAILPFSNLSTDKGAEKAHVYLREGIFLELKKRDFEQTTTIQDIAETDKRLAEAGITVDMLKEKTPSELGELLGCDALVNGTLLKFHEKGKTGQVVTAVLFGTATGAEVICRVSITDCSTKNLLFEWELNEKGGFFTSPESVANKIGIKIAKKWPFKKKS